VKPTCSFVVALFLFGCNQDELVPKDYRIITDGKHWSMEHYYGFGWNRSIMEFDTKQEAIAWAWKRFEWLEHERTNKWTVVR
jgi:hypothetical protein